MVPSGAILCARAALTCTDGRAIPLPAPIFGADNLRAVSDLVNPVQSLLDLRYSVIDLDDERRLRHLRGNYCAPERGMLDRHLCPENRGRFLRRTCCCVTGSAGQHLDPLMEFLGGAECAGYRGGRFEGHRGLETGRTENRQEQS